MDGGSIRGREDFRCGGIPRRSWWRLVVARYRRVDVRLHRHDRGYGSVQGAGNWFLRFFHFFRHCFHFRLKVLRRSKILKKVVNPGCQQSLNNLHTFLTVRSQSLAIPPQLLGSQTLGSIIVLLRMPAHLVLPKQTLADEPFPTTITRVRLHTGVFSLVNPVSS